MRSLLSFCLALLASCAVPPPQSPPPEPLPEPPGGYFEVPRPGASIRDARPCRCQVCREARCCTGDQGEPEATGECGAAHAYDTSGCGMAITTCGGHCQIVGFSAGKDETCDGRAPATCCPGSVEAM